MAGNFDPDEEEALCRWTLADLKQRVQDAGDQLGEAGDLSMLGPAVDKCKESLEKKNMDALEIAMQECRGALAHACQDRSIPDAEAPRRSEDWLESWRPGRACGRADDSSYEDSSEAPTQPPSRTEWKRREDEEHLSSATSCIPKKAEADEATRRGDFADALHIYEALIASDFAWASSGEEAALEDREFACAIFSNAALCSLKLGPDERCWPRVTERLRRTVELCDKALELDRTHAKSNYRRGCALEALERFPEAYRAYERAAAHEPADAKIREAMDRIVLYDVAELGTEVYAEAKKRLETLEPALAARERQRRRKVGRAPSALYACCRCRGDGRVGNFFALPCGHGPYCRDCRARIVREGRGLMFCAAPLCGDIITEFQEGPVESMGDGMLKSATGQSSKGGSSRPVFGPELPPEMRRKSARPKSKEAVPKADSESAAICLHTLD